MELYTIKSGGKYVKTSGGRYQLCGLNKASVFPGEALAEVREHRIQAEKEGLRDLEIYLLTIVEKKIE